MVLLIILRKGVGEASINSVFLIYCDRTLDGIVANDVTVCEVFGDNARARFVFLGNIAIVTFAMVCVGTGSSEFIQARSTRDLNLGITELCVV